MTKSNKKNKNRTDWKAVLKLAITVSILFCGLLISGFLTVLFYDWYTTTKEFNLKKVEVVDNYLLDKQEIIDLSKLENGKRILDLDLESIRKKINKSTYIENCKVSLILPATVEITVREEEPVAFLLKKGKLKYISKTNQIIGSVKPEKTYNLPLINGSFSSELISFLSLAKDLSPFVYHQISEICEEKRGLRFYLTQNSVPVIIGYDDFDEKILVIENFLREEGSKLNYTNLEYIDLRFDKQVVVKEIKCEVAEAAIDI